ncbi:MAG: hypothetical protein M1814_004638 [Vezdaea aestivalis]|nr:MAG: hypothetical protein M1814_004638 [Vezdaea aestivalis]
MPNPTPENATMLQGFEWYVPDDHKHWQRLAGAVAGLKAVGVDNIWIPPGCKAQSPSGNGYDIYDLYDLGEYDQKGSRSTKWGSKEELFQLLEEAKKSGVGIYWDAVLNHKAGADHTERCKAVEVDPNDRTKVITDPYEITGWLGFDFPGRGDKDSCMKYHWHHFTGTDYNDENKKEAIYKIVGDNKDWSKSVDLEKGNYDYLMFADLDYSHGEVEQDVMNWGVWITKTAGLKGIRFDAIKHFSEDFLKRFLKNIDESVGLRLFCVGEFWKDSLSDMTGYLERMDHQFSLFDAPLVYNFSQMSKESNTDLSKVFNDTLVQVKPVNAVTLIMNHDTQPYQALEASIEDWFKPLAYALILFRESGYPCLFYGDLYGIKGEHSFPPSCQGKLPDLSLARKLYAYGEQNDYFDPGTCIGWVRRGTEDRPDGLACVLSSAGINEKRMDVGTEHSGQKWTDVLGWESSEVLIGDDGFGTFPVGGTSVAVWVNEKAQGRERFGKFNANIYET